MRSIPKTKKKGQSNLGSGNAFVILQRLENFRNSACKPKTALALLSPIKFCSHTRPFSSRLGIIFCVKRFKQMSVRWCLVSNEKAQRAADSACTGSGFLAPTGRCLVRESRSKQQSRPLRHFIRAIRIAPFRCFYPHPPSEAGHLAKSCRCRVRRTGRSASRWSYRCCRYRPPFAHPVCAGPAHPVTGGSARDCLCVSACADTTRASTAFDRRVRKMALRYKMAPTGTLNVSEPFRRRRRALPVIYGWRQIGWLQMRLSPVLSAWGPELPLVPVSSLRAHPVRAGSWCYVTSAHVGSRPPARQ